jgi:dihydroneopterin aldolase
MQVLTEPRSAGDAIELDVRLSCIVGILPRERVEPQPLEIRLELELDLGGVGDTGDLARGVDYAAIDDQVRFLAVEGRFRLLESLGLAILRVVLAPPVERACVRIVKPAVLRASVPAVRLARDAAWAGAGAPDVVIDVSEVEVRRVTLAPGETLASGVALVLAGSGDSLVVRRR